MRNPAAQGRPDANHAEIVEAYLSVYASVIDTHTLGKGFPDLVIGIAGETELVEIKSEHGQLRPSQNEFIGHWRGRQPVVVRTPTDAINHAQNVRERVSRARYRQSEEL